MELVFEKVSNQYVAEFEATNDFNLHIEREEIGVLEVHQRGSEEGKYDFAWGTGINGRKVIDYDFGALVYPKYIKVVSSSEVLSASVNFNEGGGSGSGSGEASTIEYLDVSNMDDNDNKVNLITKSNIIRIEKDGYIMCTTPTMVLDSTLTIGQLLDYFASATIAVCIDFNLVHKYPDGEFTNKELLFEHGFTQEQLDAIPRITKEQFYNLEV